MASEIAKAICLNSNRFLVADDQKRAESGLRRFVGLFIRRVSFVSFVSPPLRSSLLFGRAFFVGID